MAEQRLSEPAADEFAELDGDRLRPLADLSESRIWRMIESAPDGMVMADEHGVILVVNGQLESMFGYGREELLGRKIEELLPDRFRQIHAAHRTRYRVEPQVRFMGAGLELLGRRRDGSEFPVEVSLSPVSDEHGVAVIAAVRDISERVAAEAYANLIRATIDATHDGVFMFSPDTLRFSYVNHGAVTQTGYSRDELLAMTPLHIAPELTRDSFVETIAPLLNDETSRLTMRTVHRMKTGYDIPVEVLLECPPASHPSAPRVVVALVRDITDRLESERLLQSSESLFRAAFDDAPAGMLIGRLEPSGARIVERVNLAFCEMLGRAQRELVGIDLAELTHPDDENADVGAAAEMRAGKRGDYATEKRYRHADGSYVWVQLRSTLLDPSDHTRVLGHVVDITERRAAEAERERQQRWLQGLTDIRVELRTHPLEGRPAAEALELICARARGIIGADMSAAGRLDPAEQLLHLDTVHGDPLLGPVPVSIPVGPSLRAVLDARQPAAFEHGLPRDDGNDGNGNDVTVAFAGPLVVVPLTINHELADVLVCGRHPDRPPFDATEMQFIESLAQRANADLQLARAQRDQQRLTLLEDRERIGRDLHDMVIQRIFAAGMGLDALGSYGLSAPVTEKVRGIVDELDTAIKELRSTIFGLSMLESPRSIAVQISENVAAHADQLGFTPTLTTPDDIESIPLVVVEQLLPTINEALSNVARHADATSAAIVIELTDSELTVEVTDNGNGINEEQIRGRGLGNLEARARRVGGSCRITNNEAGGATVTWRAPL